jgi:CO dehydrogenase maturation factor
MKIALVGKGGAGKSAVGGTLCRILARSGHDVLALDADNVPGLAFTLGVDPGDAWLLSEAASFVHGEGWKLLVEPGEAVERYAVRGPDGIRFLQFGKISGQLTRQQQASSAALLQIVRRLDDERFTVVIDLAAGTRQSYFGWTGIARTILVIVEPSAKSVLTARRLVRLGQERPELRLLGVANKIGTDAERRFVGRELERIGIPFWAEVPVDPIFAAAERRGMPPIDIDPASPAVRAVEEIAERLAAETART